MGFRQTPRRIAQTGLHCQSQHHSERLAAIRYSHQSRTTPTRNFLADFPASLSAPDADLRFLHRRDGPPPNALCALLHRVRDAPCASCGLYCISQCRLGNPTSASTHLAIRGTERPQSAISSTTTIPNSIGRLTPFFKARALKSFVLPFMRRMPMPLPNAGYELYALSVWIIC